MCFRVNEGFASAHGLGMFRMFRVLVLGGGGNGRGQVATGFAGFILTLLLGGWRCAAAAAVLPPTLYESLAL